MATIAEMIREVNDEGYFDENAEAKVCQDIVLKALSESSLNRNATIKGGVVMRLSRSRKNWLGVNEAEVLSTIEMFLRDC